MIYVVSLCFNNPTALEKMVENFYASTDTQGLTGIQWIFVDCCYPLPSREAVTAKIDELAKRDSYQEPPIVLTLEKNFGQDGNYNKVFEYLKNTLKAKPTDSLVFWDPDNLPQDKNWLSAALSLRTLNRKAGYVTLHRHHPQFDMRGQQGPLQSEVGIRYRRLKPTGGWPMALWSMEFVLSMMPIHQSHSYYGGTEMNIYSALQRTGFLGLMLEDYEDLMTSVDFDKEYIIWKAIVINSTQHMDFEEWLKHYRLKELIGGAK